MVHVGMNLKKVAEINEKLLQRLLEQRKRGEIRPVHVDILHTAYLGSKFPVVEYRVFDFGTNTATMQQIYQNILTHAVKEEFGSDFEWENVSSLTKTAQLSQVKDEVLRKTLELWPTLENEAKLNQEKDIASLKEMEAKLIVKNDLSSDEKRNLKNIQLYLKYPGKLHSYKIPLAMRRIIPDLLKPLKGIVIPHRCISDDYSENLPLKKGEKPNNKTRYLVTKAHLATIASFLASCNRNPNVPFFHRVKKE